jgi:hypothetical protein
VSLLFIPLLFLAAGLTIPYGFVGGRLQRRRERTFQNKMQAVGRLVSWEDFITAMDESRGTLIEERYSFKGPVRLWWVSENFYDVCPYPTVDWLTMCKEEQFRTFVEWCRENYTNPERGRALLVSSPPKGGGLELHRRLVPESGKETWIAVPPPEALRRKKKGS